MEFKVSFHHSFLAIALLSLVMGITGCGAITPVPTATQTTAPTNTTAPTTTDTLTSKPLPTAASTPTDLELLDESTQFLFSEPASYVIDFFLEIQDCVRTDNKEKLAGMVRYPITIHSIDGKDVEIQNDKEFIASYEKIATPKWKGVILAQEPTKLFTNWAGVTVNRGEMWFGPWCIETCENMKFYILGIINDTPW